MNTQWILSSASLPRPGRPIYFLLANRTVPMHGSFAKGIFHAHWSDYEVDCVQSWCVDEDEASKSTLKGRLLQTLKRYSPVRAKRH
jgi:hypothetical protein